MKSTLGVLLDAGIASGAAARRKGKQDGKPGAASPCGDGTRKDNRCAKDGDCCTGICRKGLTNTDRQGRCRCVRNGRACAENRNCCSGFMDA